MSLMFFPGFAEDGVGNGNRAEGHGKLIEQMSGSIRSLEEILQGRHIAIKAGTPDIMTGTFQMDDLDFIV